MDNKENEVVYLHLDDIIPNRFQPRQIFDEKALKELAVSIKEHGVIQPIIVRNIGNKYEIIAGERRYKASALAGLTTIPAIVRNLDDKESSKVALLENLQRKNLNPIEEAKTYQKILELDQMTQEELAKTMGKSQSAVANKLRLLSLTDDVQDALLKDQISERHARTLLNAKDADTQKKLLKEVIDNKLTVRELEEKINPKEELTKTDIDNLLNPSPVSTSIENGGPFNMSNQSSPSLNDNFNRSVGIDYSTPPKFIDYDVPNITDNLESTANKSIDINAIKDNARDINFNEPMENIPSTPNPNEFFNVPTIDNNKEEPAKDFKFFTPIEEESKSEAPKQESNLSMFDTPAPTNAPFINDNPFNLGGETKNIKDSTSTSMDSLLAGVTDKENNQQTPPVPSVNPFNNPFAKNPIFSDTIKTNEQNQQERRPKYTLNESINLIRETLKKLEESGLKIDSEEMDLVNNYQITIKISKDNE